VYLSDKKDRQGADLMKGILPANDRRLYPNIAKSRLIKLIKIKEDIL
jgi:hypothetical protein